MERSTLDRSAVQEWLSDQRAAASRIETERVHFLLTLTPERAFDPYVNYYRPPEAKQNEPVSPLLMAMRRALAKREQR